MMTLVNMNSPGMVISADAPGGAWSGEVFSGQIH